MATPAGAAAGHAWRASRASRTIGALDSAQQPLRYAGRAHEGHAGAPFSCFRWFDQLVAHAETI
eukprot:12249477-Alexandrium_andersonii.AAC.1